MKTLIFTLALLVALPTFASTDCKLVATGGTRTETMTFVPLNQFSIDSWMDAQTVTTTYPEYVRVCTESYPTVATIPTQHFPSVPLASFGINSWSVAK